MQYMKYHKEEVMTKGSSSQWKWAMVGQGLTIMLSVVGFVMWFSYVYETRQRVNDLARELRTVEQLLVDGRTGGVR